MTSYAKTRRSSRERYWTPERVEALKSWCVSPFTPRASIIVPAVVGAIAFVALLFVGLSV